MIICYYNVIKIINMAKNNQRILLFCTKLLSLILQKEKNLVKLIKKIYVGFNDWMGSLT